MNPKHTRRYFIAELKAEVALAALMERQPLAESATRYWLLVAQISRWNLHLRQQAAQVFAEAAPLRRPCQMWSRSTRPSGGCRWKTNC